MIELNHEELRDFGERVVEIITRYLDSLPELPVFPPGATPADLRMLLAEPLPRQPQGVEAALEDFMAKIVPYSARVGHPRFLGWIRPSPLGGAVYAEALAAALNQSVAVWEGAPAATEVELRVIEWLKEMAGYAPEAGGLLTSGGSVANFVCLLAARSAADPQARELGLAGRAPLTIYITGETHYCVQKAAEMMGIGRRYVRTLPVDENLRMDPQALAEAIQADRAAGLQPMAVAATLGTVNSGACDDLLALRHVCNQEGVWLHVDGAYGGLAGLVPEKKALTAGLETADSLAFDPHKSLFIPFEAGCALVRDPGYLLSAFSMESDYLPNSLLEGMNGVPSPNIEDAPFHFRDYGPQLSRSFRALKIYLALKIYGVEAIAGEMSRLFRLASALAERIQAADDFELLAPVPLGIVAFRYLGQIPAGTADPEAWLDQLNTCLPAVMQRQGRVFLAGTRLKSQAALRVCFVSYRTTEADLDMILREVRATGKALSEQGFAHEAMGRLGGC